MLLVINLKNLFGKNKSSFVKRVGFNTKRVKIDNYRKGC